MFRYASRLLLHGPEPDTWEVVLHQGSKMGTGMCFSPSEESKNDVASVIPIRFFYPHLRWADCSFILSLTFCSTDVSPDSAFSYCFCIIGYLIISFRGSWWAPRKARPCNRVGTAGWTQCSGAYIDLSPPFNPGIFWGGKTRNLWEIFHLTTWNIYINIPPHMFFWLPKEVGGGPPDATF